MKTIADRLKEAREIAGLTQPELASRAGVSAGTIGNIESGIRKNPRELLAIAAATGVSAEWLKTGRGAKTAQEQAPVYIKDADELLIPQFDTGGAMGDGLLLRDQPGVIRGWSVNREWLSKNLKNHTGAGNLCIVTGFGDSMKGMYNSGDPLVVDTGVKKVEYDAVYFFRVGDEGFIKRLQRIPGEGLVAISENKAYRDWTIKPDMDFEVFGRVLKAWKGEDF